MELCLAYLDERLVLAGVVFWAVSVVPFCEDAIGEAGADPARHREHGKHLGIRGQPRVQISGESRCKAGLLALKRALGGVAGLAGEATAECLVGEG